MSSDAAGRGDAVMDGFEDSVRRGLEDALPPAQSRRVDVRAADPEAGTVVLSFGCGCSSGTLAPPAKAALETRLTGEITALERVEFESGCGCGSTRGRTGTRRSSDGETPDAPF